MCQFIYDDLDVRPDIYPWLANVYIEEKYRNKGYGRILIENATKVAHDVIQFNELFLYTKHIGLYEKFGWKYIGDIDTFKDESRIERLYKLDIHKEWS